MNGPSKLAAALTGIRRLAAFDINAWGYFDKTLQGFWASFLVAAVLAPLDIAHVLLQTSDQHMGFVPYAIVEMLAYVLQWTIFPFVMLYIVQLLQRPGNYFSYLVPYNWMQLPLGLFFFGLQLAGDLGLIPAQGAGILQLAGWAVFCIYGAFVAGVGLQAGIGTGVALVVLDFVLSQILGEVIMRIEAAT